jgi:IS5 family transposase
MVAECVEKMKAGMRAKVEHPFRVVKRRFGYTKVRYRGLAKKNGADRHAVRVVEPVDGAPKVRVKPSRQP